MRRNAINLKNHFRNILDLNFRGLAYGIIIYFLKALVVLADLL